MGFFDGSHFNSHLRFRLHLIQLFLVIVAIGLTVGRLASLNRPSTRSDTLAIVMGAKSIVVIGYELLTEHVDKFKRWSSTLAYAILNCLEVVFWFAVIVLTFMGISAYCDGTGCALAWVLVLVSFVIVFLALWTSVIAIKDHRFLKHNGVPRGSTSTLQGSRSYNIGVDHYPVRRK